MKNFFFLLLLSFLFLPTILNAQTTFGEQQIISANADNANSVYAIDLDGDGDNDVLSASIYDDKIAWYKNDGNGNFGIQQIISTNANGASFVYAIDLDNDGDNDILSASSFDDKIAWYENDGIGNFSAEQIISTNADGAYSVYAIDIDGDGDNDVLSASANDNKIAWYANDGNGNFSTEQIISTNANGAKSVYAIDIDNDGNNDVLSTSVVDNKIAWYTNNGNGNFSTQQIISANAFIALSIYAIDVDNDGDNDVLFTSLNNDKIAWYENDGTGNFSTEQIISTNADGANFVYAIDLDNDGDNDVLSASVWDSKIAWYENDGIGNFSTEQIISTNALSARSVYAIDLDNDGDNDVLSASAGDYKIAWYENISLSTTEALPPTANFTTTPSATAAATNPDTLLICNGQTVYFNNQSENANSYLWNFGDDANTTTQTNPTHTYNQAGTYTVSLIAYNNTPEPFACEADAGYLEFNPATDGVYITEYNYSFNYTQKYFTFDTDSNLIGIYNDYIAALLFTASEYLVTVNYLNSQAITINNIADLQQQVDNGACIDFDVYNTCNLSGYLFYSTYNADYNGYLIAYDPTFELPLDAPDNYESYAAPYHVAYALINWESELTLYLLDTNYQPFTPGDTIHFCPTNNGVVYCCKTIIIPLLPPGGGSPEALVPNTPIAPIYSARASNNTTDVLSDTTYLVVVVQPSLAPDITCITTLCANDTAQYHTSAICSSYQWAVTGGTITNGQGTPNIDVVWGNTPEGTISLTADCGEAYCNLPTVVAVPILTPSAAIEGKNNVCLNEICNYTLPFFGGTTYNWTIDPPQAGEIILGNNSHQISVQWTNMEATLTASYQNQVLDCNGTASLNITPIPAFAIDTLNIVCQGTQNTISTTENGNFTWSVVGGTILSAQNTDNISVLYTNEGLFSVSATPNNPNLFCNESNTATTTVLPYPQSPTIVGAPSICPTETYLYTASPIQNNTTFIWTAQGGTIVSGQNSAAVNVIWNQTPPYSLSVVRQTNSQPNCTSNATTLPVNSLVDGGGLTITGNNNVCPASSITYMAMPAVPNLLYQWSISPETAGQITQGQGTNQITIQWSANEPSNNVVLSVTACNLTANYDITFATVPQPIISQNNVLCSNNTATLLVGNVSDISNYVWQDENGNTFNSSTLNVDTSGIYSVLVTNNSGCSGYTSINVLENTAPIAQILSPSYIVCVQEPLNIPLLAINGTNYSFEWLLNDTPIASVDIPFYIHFGTNVEGTFAYKVSVTDTLNGCVTLSNAAAITQTVCVPDTTGGGGGGGPTDPNCPATATHQVNFSLQTAGAGTSCQTVELTNLSTGDFTQFIVFWGDGTSDILSGNTITHIYPNDVAIYNVVLKGWFIHPLTDAPCYKTHIEQHQIPLAARFDVTAACLGNEWHFQDRSYYLPTTNITNWTWDFGDGSPTLSGNQTVAHTYTNAGIFNVTLTITDGNCTTSATQTITVDALPNIDFSVSGGICVNNVLNFTPNNATFTNYSWSFGDGSTSSIQNPAHQYNAAASYTAILSATNSLGCVAISNPQNISINPQPIPQNITATDTLLCSGETAILTAPLGAAYLWSTSDNSNSIAVSAANNYTVKVTLADGCYYTSPPQNIQVVLAPNATIYPASDTAHFCNNNGTAFLNVPNNSNYTYQWMPYNNSTAQQQAYYNDTYRVTVTDTETGCTATDQVVAIIHGVYNVPTIAANTVSVCEGNAVQLWVTSNQDNVDHYVWTNGAEDSLISVTTSGNYGVYAVDNWGCTSDTSAIATVTVNALPNVSFFPAGCYEICLGDTIHLPINMGINYQWFFNDTLINSNNGNFVPQHQGDYFVVMTNPNSCIDTTGILSLQFKTNCPTEHALPISLIDFSGTVKEVANLLHWASASEINCDYYTLYHSTDGNNFVPITTTKGAGNSMATQHYQYLHNTKAMLSYYRLAETDYDGTTTKLGTIVLRRADNGTPNLFVYPNPAKTVLQINYQSTQTAPIVLKIYDAMGRLLHTQTETVQSNTNTYQLNVENYPIGIYWLQIGEQVVKWIKD